MSSCTRNDVPSPQGSPRIPDQVCDTLTLFFACRSTNTQTFRKDEFSVIIIGLDGAGKTVRTLDRRRKPISNVLLITFLSSLRLSSRRSKLYIMTRRACHQTRSPPRWARTVRTPRPPAALAISSDLSSLRAAGKIALPSAMLQFWDLGGQRGIRSIWPKYYDDCHAVVYVVDAVDHERLSEGWEAFGTFLLHPPCPSRFLFPALPQR